jgi:Zn-dependent M28 family amino/carboxypeptidase
VRANDDVRSYILSRVTGAASGRSFVTVDSDTRSNASWAGSVGQGIYFEGTNVLVKVDGTDPALSQKSGAVLFSAHYDSVSTAPGATDDGMGVATLLQMVDYLAENRPKRTAVFNINNGEEDGLHGAHV